MANQRDRRRPRSDQWTEEDARRILGEWTASGLPLYPFARTRGITPQRLAWWRDRLTKGSAGPVLLAPARVTAGPVVLSTSGGVVVRLPGGVTLELGDVSPGWVATLIRELTSCS
jgi:hypothetical protein